MTVFIDSMHVEEVTHHPRTHQCCRTPLHTSVLELYPVSFLFLPKYKDKKWRPSSFHHAARLVFQYHNSSGRKFLDLDSISVAPGDGLFSPLLLSRKKGVYFSSCCCILIEQYYFNWTEKYCCRH